MNIFDTVSETALITLKARSVEAGKTNPIIVDSVGLDLLESIRSFVPTKKQEMIMAKELSSNLTRYIALRLTYPPKTDPL